MKIVQDINRTLYKIGPDKLAKRMGTRYFPTNAGIGVEIAAGISLLGLTGFGVYQLHNALAPEAGSLDSSRVIDPTPSPQPTRDLKPIPKATPTSPPTPIPSPEPTATLVSESVPALELVPWDEPGINIAKLTAELTARQEDGDYVMYRLILAPQDSDTGIQLKTKEVITPRGTTINMQWARISVQEVSSVLSETDDSGRFVPVDQAARESVSQSNEPFFVYIPVGSDQVVQGMCDLDSLYKFIGFQDGQQILYVYFPDPQNPNSYSDFGMFTNPGIAPLDFCLPTNTTSSIRPEQQESELYGLATDLIGQYWQRFTDGTLTARIVSGAFRPEELNLWLHFISTHPTLEDEIATGMMDHLTVLKAIWEESLAAAASIAEHTLHSTKGAVQKDPSRVATALYRGRIKKGF
ncbi:hypothetical protein KC622_00045 [Candidatus Dojkabacteria bacterium]|uniref:Uncharacterized protein n=1 Tax=Candidatus Dojkabacteria bacterium TaxID=2099670 RepID=A0A955KVB2_9BACT|nr:hypothetical protein [Candidatus Dojkabacteria bacterium]